MSTLVCASCKGKGVSHKCGGCMLPAYCSEKCAQTHWTQTHERECIGAGPFDMFALPTMGKEYFFEQIKYMKFKDLGWAIGIAKPEAQDKILGWLSEYDPNILQKIMLVTAMVAELLPFFKKLIADYNKYRPWSNMSARNAKYAMAKTTIKYCNITAFKWLLENSHVTIDDAMLIEIINKWPDCATKGAGSIEFVIKEFTKGHNPQHRIMEFFEKNKLAAKILANFFEQVIYYGIKEDYVIKAGLSYYGIKENDYRYLNRHIEIAGVVALSKVYEEYKPFYRLLRQFQYNGFKIIDHLLKNVPSFTWPWYFVDLIMKYSHFKGEMFEVDDIWNNAWEKFVQNKTEALLHLLFKLLHCDILRTNVSIILLWKILIYDAHTLWSDHGDLDTLSHPLFTETYGLINYKIQQPSELEKLVRYVSTVELRPIYIEVLCEIISKPNCSKMVKQIIDWFLPREHKLRNILQLPKIVNRNPTEFDVIDPPPKTYSIDMLRATLISYYTYELLETQEDKTFIVDFGDDDGNVLCSVTEGSSHMRVTVVPYYSSWFSWSKTEEEETLTAIAEYATEAYGLFVIEQLLIKGYKYMNLQIIDKKTKEQHLHEKSESIKRKVF